MWAKLSDLCQGGFGVVSMPEYVRIALFKAGALVPAEPEGSPVTYEQYVEKLGTLHYDFQRAYPSEVLYRLDQFSRHFHPAFEKRITVEDLEIDTSYCVPDRLMDITVQLIHDVPAYWVPAGKNRAFDLFQFLPHEKTNFLQDPQTVWICAVEKLNLFEAKFATLVQLQGLRGELKMPNPPGHIIRNIFERPNLSNAERIARRELFPKVVDYFIDHIEQLML